MNYDELFELSRNERAEKELRSLPPSFDDDVLVIIETFKKEQPDDPYDGECRQIKNVRSLRTMILGCRARKIMELAAAKANVPKMQIDFTRFTKADRWLFVQCERAMESYIRMIVLSEITVEIK